MQSSKSEGGLSSSPSQKGSSSAMAAGTAALANSASPKGTGNTGNKTAAASSAGNVGPSSSKEVLERNLKDYRHKIGDKDLGKDAQDRMMPIDADDAKKKRKHSLDAANGPSSKLETSAPENHSLQAVGSHSSNGQQQHSQLLNPQPHHPSPHLPPAVVEDLSSIPSCIIPVSFANISASPLVATIPTTTLGTMNNKQALLDASAMPPPSLLSSAIYPTTVAASPASTNTSQFVDANYSIVNSGRDLSRTSKTRNLLINSPSATKTMNNLQLVATSSAHAHSIAESLSSATKAKMSSRPKSSFSAMTTGVSDTSIVAQTPSHYYASPRYNETPFSPIKRRKLFKSSEAAEKAIAPAQLDEEFDELPVFVHVATPKTTSTPAVTSGSAAPAIATLNNSVIPATDLFKIPLATAVPAEPSSLTLNNISKPSALDEAQTKSTIGYDLLATKLKIASKGLCSVLPKASKVVTTRDWRMAQDEVRIANVLQSMEKLKEQNLWSFKQIKAQVHPPRPKVQWDYMLEEMAWMSEDFRQERRWKVAAAYNISRWVLEWHATTDKSLVCVRVVSTSSDYSRSVVAPAEDVNMIPQDEEVLPADGNASAWRPGSDQIESTEQPAKAQTSADPKSILISAPNGVQKSSYPITIDLSSNTYMLSSSAPLSSALSHIESYVCPVYNPLDLYKENEEQIVPVSKFMLSRYHIPSPQVNSMGGRRAFSPLVRGNGHLYLKDFKEQRQLHSQKLPCNTSLFLAAFPSGTDGDQHQLDDTAATSDELFGPPLASTRPDTTPAAPGWTSDEEDALWQFAHLYNGNWALITDSLNGIRVGNSGKRSLWCCFDKYLDLANGSFNSHSSVDYLYAPCQSNKKDRKVKALGLLSTFNFIVGLAKRRDETRPKFSKPNKPVNLAAHHTHKDVKVEKGIDLDGIPKGPFELSRIKEQRDAIAEQARQAAYQQSFIRPKNAQFAMGPQGMPGNNFGPRPMRPMNPQQPQLQNQPGSTLFPAQQPGIPNFRAPFQGSPQQIHQIQQLANRINAGVARPMGMTEQQVAAAAAQGMQFGGGIPAMQRLVQQQMQARPPAGMMQMPGMSRSHIGDASTAAAYAALQNAQNAIKQNNRPVGPPMAQQPQIQQQQQQQPSPKHQGTPLTVHKSSSSASVPDLALSEEGVEKGLPLAPPPDSSFNKTPTTLSKASVAAAEQSTPSKTAKNAPSPSAANSSSSPGRTSKRKQQNSSPLSHPLSTEAPVLVEEEEEEEEVDQIVQEQVAEEEVSEEAPPPPPASTLKKRKGASAAQSPTKVEDPPSSLSAAPLRRTSRFSNPGASTAPVPPSVALPASSGSASSKSAHPPIAAAGSVSSGRAARTSNRRKQKQPVVRETEDDELEGGVDEDEEEDELDQTEASSAITSIEEEDEVESDAAPSPKKTTRASRSRNRK